MPVYVTPSLALFVLLTSVAPTARAQDPAAMMARIEAAQVPNRGALDGFTLAEVMARFNVPGVSVAVIKDFSIHWAKGYGVADVETQKPVDVNTAFQAASISKPVTAMAAVKLAQGGRFSLDQDVNTLLTSWKVPESEHTRSTPVTPRALFSHTSGSDDGFGFPGYAPGTPMPTPVQVIKGDKPSNTGTLTFGRPPYRAAKYSGGGTIIMQLALTEFTGQPFAELMQATVLDPLGMSGSSYRQPPAPEGEARLARAHSGAGRRMGAPWHVYPEQAAAGLWTTPSDLARFAIEVQKVVRGEAGAVLTQQGAREMTSPVGTGPFAVGFQVEKRGEGWYFMHGGSNWGFRCNLIAHLRKGYGIVIMTNADNGTAAINEIESRVAAAYGWDSLDKPLIR